MRGDNFQNVPPHSKNTGDGPGRRSFLRVNRARLSPPYSTHTTATPAKTGLIASPHRRAALLPSENLPKILPLFPHVVFFAT